MASNVTYKASHSISEDSTNVFFTLDIMTCLVLTEYPDEFNVMCADPYLLQVVTLSCLNEGLSKQHHIFGCSLGQDL